MNRVFSLVIESALENLKDVRSFINEAGHTLNIDADTLGDLCLVVDEAVTNIIVHGYDDQPGPIEIHVSAEQVDLVIQIRDQAAAFNDSDVEAPHLDEALSERAYGGMGVYLIRSLTDEHEFRSLPEQGNELRLVKYGVVRN